MGVNWDGFVMRRTIALKLSEEEEKIVTQLNKKSMSNSEILRNALHHYFELIQESHFQDYPFKRSLHVEEHPKTRFNVSIEELKQEV
jgi:hypothetical protein